MTTPSQLARVPVEHLSQRAHWIRAKVNEKIVVVATYQIRLSLFGREDLLY